MTRERERERERGFVSGYTAAGSQEDLVLLVGWASMEDVCLDFIDAARPFFHARARREASCRQEMVKRESADC